jgi:hypothetical protein
MTLCSIVSAVQAVRTAVAAMRARCGVPAGIALEPVNTATLAGDGGGRGLLADIYWKAVAAVTDMNLLETVARPITPGEQGCHANPWIDQVREWIDGIVPSYYTVIGSGFSGRASVLNRTVLVAYWGQDEFGSAAWNNFLTPYLPRTDVEAFIWYRYSAMQWVAYIEATNIYAGTEYAEAVKNGVAGCEPAVGSYVLRPGYVPAEEYEHGSITVLQGDQT